MSNPLPEQLLKEEYFHLQKTVEDFDQRSITIKNWSVTFAFAAIAGAFTSKAPIVFLVAAGASLGFWIIDALWKGFQYAYYHRIIEIEDYFLGKTASLKPLQITHAWSSAWKAGGWKKPVICILWPAVFLPHALVVILGVALYFFS
jgi:hypothetical protein